MKKINLAEKFALFDELWTPKIVAESNGQLVKLAKGKGQLIWHSHQNEDELFLVIAGQLTIKLRGMEDVVLRPGELFVVPKGVEHCPCAEAETQFLLVEPSTTQHTGEHRIHRTVDVEQQEWI